MVEVDYDDGGREPFLPGNKKVMSHPVCCLPAFIIAVQCVFSFFFFFLLTSNNKGHVCLMMA